jgi:hypothetical protein
MGINVGPRTATLDDAPGWGNVPMAVSGTAITLRVPIAPGRDWPGASVPAGALMHDKRSSETEAVRQRLNKIVHDLVRESAPTAVRTPD